MARPREPTESSELILGSRLKAFNRIWLRSYQLGLTTTLLSLTPPFFESGVNLVPRNELLLEAAFVAIHKS